MEKQYEPELGQAVFGQPSQEFAVSELLEAALGHIREELNRVLWNRLQQDCRSPFDNSSARFETEGLSIHAYDWGDDDQPWNLKCGDIEISWYKYIGRGMSVNRAMTPDDIDRFLEKAISIVRACDSPSFGDEADAVNFTYQ